MPCYTKLSDDPGNWKIAFDALTYIDTVTVGNILRTLLHGEPPPTLATAKEIVDESLSIAMHAMRVGMHTTLGSSP